MFIVKQGSPAGRRGTLSLNKTQGEDSSPKHMPSILGGKVVQTRYLF